MSSNQMKGGRKYRKPKKKSAQTTRLGPGDYRVRYTHDGGEPDSQIATLSYSDTVTIAAAAIRTNYVYRGNSLYDPDYNTGGHQPRYFDQKMAVYTKYKVLSVKMWASFINLSGDTPITIIVVPITDPLVVGLDITNMAELPRAKVVGPLAIAARKPERCKGQWTTRGVCGLSSSQLASESWSGDDSSSPSSIWYINFLAYSNNFTNYVDVSMNITIEYTSLFYDRRPPELSLSNPNNKDKPRPESGAVIQLQTPPKGTDQLFPKSKGAGRVA